MRKQEDKPVVASADGMKIAIYQKFMQKAEQLGCSREDFLRFASQEGEYIIERLTNQMAHGLNCQANKLRNSFSVLVDWDIPLEDMIRAGEYDEVSPEIHEYAEVFKKGGKRGRDIKIVLIPFRLLYCTKIKDMVSQLSDWGLRPAFGREFLAFGATHRDQGWIMSPSCFCDYDGRRPLCIGTVMDNEGTGRCKKRRLGFADPGFDYDEYLNWGDHRRCIATYNL